MIAQTKAVKEESQPLRHHWFNPNGGEIADLLVGLTEARKTLGVRAAICTCAMSRAIYETTKGFTGFTARWNGTFVSSPAKG